MVKSKQTEVKSDRTEILRIVEDFYRELYRRRDLLEDATLPRVQNQGSEDIPEITEGEIRSVRFDEKQQSTWRRQSSNRD